MKNTLFSAFMLSICCLFIANKAHSREIHTYPVYDFSSDTYYEDSVKRPLTSYQPEKSAKNAFLGFLRDICTDTKELYKRRPELRGIYLYDFLDDGDKRSKVGASMPIVAYKFITIDPSFVYTPDTSRKTGEFGLTFSIRPNRIPLGDGFTVGDMFDAETPEWLKRFYLGVYTSHNFSTGKFGLGVASGIKF